VPEKLPTLLTQHAQVSLHFRGPIAIKQFAVYYPAAVSSSSSSSAAAAPVSTGKNSLGLKRGKRANPAERRHPHAHAHFHDNNKVREIQDAEIEKRQLGAMVTAVIDGQTVSWKNDWDGMAHQATSSAAAPSVAKSSSAAAAVVPTSAAAAAAVPVVASSAAKASSQVVASSSAAAKASSAPLASGSWARAGYYNSAQGVSQGLSFLNHLGGGSSGVFD